MKNNKLKIIAGPDGVDNINCNTQLLNKMSILEQVDMVRCVGAKSRTSLTPGNFAGIDYTLIKTNQDILTKGGSTKDFILANLDGSQTSLDMAKENYLRTGKGFATEVSGGIVQLLMIQEFLARNSEASDMPVMIWNPAVDQLANNIDIASRIAASNNWSVGIKNSHAFGEVLELAESESYKGETSLEKRIKGMVEICLNNGVKDIAVIMRGVDIGDKTSLGMRNVETPYTAKRLAMFFQDQPEVTMGVDHNHSMGGKKRHEILSALKKSAGLKLDNGSYLYSLVLVESVMSVDQTSHCDGDQPLYYDELVDFCDWVSKNRN
jgi:hypothetical protein